MITICLFNVLYYKINGAGKSCVIWFFYSFFKKNIFASPDLYNILILLYPQTRVKTDFMILHNNDIAIGVIILNNNNRLVHALMLRTRGAETVSHRSKRHRAINIYKKISA